MISLIVLIYCAILVLVFVLSVLTCAANAKDKRDMSFEIYMSAVFSFAWPLFIFFGLFMLIGKVFYEAGKMLYLCVLNRNK